MRRVSEMCRPILRPEPLHARLAAWEECVGGRTSHCFVYNTSVSHTTENHIVSDFRRRYEMPIGVFRLFLK